MVRRNVSRGALALSLVLGDWTASAAPLNLATGDAERDFNPAANPTVVILTDNPRPNGTSSPGDVAQDSWITREGWTTGWNIKDIRLQYDARSDTMSVGVNFFSIAGDADGNGNPGGADHRTMESGGIDVPNLGGRETITVGIDTNLDGRPDVVAGVPADKRTAGPGTDGFTVARFHETNNGLGYDYGETLSRHLGRLAFDPSAAHQDFEFTIRDFSHLPGLVPSKGFGLSAFAGTVDDIVAGEDSFFVARVPLPRGQEVPEPVTWLAWTTVAGVATWRLRRKSRP